MISFSSQSPIVPKTAHTSHLYVRAPALCCCRHSASANRQKPALRQHPPAASRQEDAGASTAAQAFAAIGFNGTLAVAGAALCGINLFGLFHWERLQDIQLAVELNALLLLIDALSFVPDYTVPVALLDPEQQPQQQPFLDVSAISALTAWDPNAWGLMLAMLRAAITAPQQLSLQVTAGLMVAREGSKELLQRGFFLTALAGWLTDRLYEADAGGLEGLVALPGGVQATVPEVGLWTASLAATALFAPAAFLAAEEAAAGVSGAMLLRTEAGSAMAAAAAAAAGKKSSSSSSTNRAAPQKGSEDEVEDPLDPEVLQYRAFKVTEAMLSSAPTQLAYRLTLAKSLGRLCLDNAVFVVTQQNLAASFTGNLLVNALLLVYARTGAVEVRPAAARE